MLFCGSILKELFRGIAWYIDDHKTLRNFALSHSLAALAAKEFAPHKKKQFLTNCHILLSNGITRMIPILPNGYVHGDIKYGRFTHRYNTGNLICSIEENNNPFDYAIKQYQALMGEEKYFLTKHFIICEQYNDRFHKFVRFQFITKPCWRLHCFHCPLCKWNHLCEFWFYDFNTNTKRFYYVFSDCDDKTRNIRPRYLTQTHQCKKFHTTITRLKIATKVVEYAKSIKNENYVKSIKSI